jgi:integrase
METERRTFTQTFTRTLRIKRLTAREVQNAKPPADRNAAMLPDGGNLYLQLTRSEKDRNHIRRSWVFRYELDGTRHDVGLGPVRTLDLSDARAKAKALRQQLLDGIDPLAAKQQIKRDRLARLAAEQRAMTFRQCAEACIASHEDGWTNRKHREQWTSSLEQYAYPVLGDLAVDDITSTHVIKTLEPIWKAIPETASRVRGRIEKVLGWAAVRGFRSSDNPARWRGHLAELFPAKGKMRSIKHLAALPFSDVPAFMAELRQRDALVAREFEFVVLTAARRGEVTGATWPEIDLKTRTWTISAGRMKGKKEHRVPLCDRAVEILTGLPRDGARVFPLHDRKMFELLQDTRPGITTHGFRSSFRDWAAERTNYPNIVVEAALSHAIGDKVEAAYRRGDLFEKRRRLMADWAAWCARPVPIGATVTPIAGAR